VGRFQRSNANLSRNDGARRNGLIGFVFLHIESGCTQDGLGKAPKVHLRRAKAKWRKIATHRGFCDTHVYATGDRNGLGEAWR
jgi:hypothetical protein